MKKGIIATAVVVIAILVGVFGFASSEPELVINDASVERGASTGSMYYNTYTFVIENDSRVDIESVEYFKINFYDSTGYKVGCWESNASELRKLALDAGETFRYQFKIKESDLPYNMEWSYDYEYEVTYYK